MMFRSKERKEKYKKEIATTKFLKPLLEAILKDQVNEILDKLGSERTLTHFSNFVYGIIARTTTESGLPTTSAADFFISFFSNGDRSMGEATYNHRIYNYKNDVAINDSIKSGYSAMDKYLKQECELIDIRIALIERLLKMFQDEIE